MEALHYAALLCYTVETIKALIERGKANLDAKANNYMMEWTALHFAAYNGHIETVKALIEAGS